MAPILGSAVVALVLGSFVAACIGMTVPGTAADGPTLALALLPPSLLLGGGFVAFSRGRPAWMLAGAIGAAAVLAAGVVGLFAAASYCAQDDVPAACEV